VSGDLPQDVQAELARLDANREAAFARLAYLNAQGITGADVDDVLAQFRRVEAGCEKVRAALWPAQDATKHAAVAWFVAKGSSLWQAQGYDFEDDVS
jgi:hypothetical protein